MPMFSPNGTINDSTDVSAPGVGLINYHAWLSPLLQVPSITHPSHICLLIEVAAGDQPVDLFIPRRLRTLKKSRFISAPMKKEERGKLFFYDCFSVRPNSGMEWKWGVENGIK